MKTVLYTSVNDNRFEFAKIVSRIGLSENAKVFSKDTNIYQDIQGNNNISCVFVDEAQFLNKEQVRQLCNVVDDFEIPVLTYGLRTDFLGEPFEGSQYLLLWADELIEVKTVCFCGKKATMNARIDNKGNVLRVGEQLDIGGNERYVSLCRKHFDVGRIS